MNNMSWDELHDSSVERVAFDWAGGIAEVIVRVGDPPSLWRIRCEGTRSLVCPRERPWGLSKYAYILEARAPVEVEAGYLRVEIDLSSGDTISIEGTAIALLPEAQQIPSEH